ncbi:Gmad2 immunoglobulin-like domain-containing protein [Nocardioides sp. AE5]|uniref:Gmad2 immunoglobulin-like domain-containing protein n=1 Tax=Nocardioides sp. AE5 TaxID=2962573 RepID=UPI00288240CE|nr:Gmad2 immunoglobulin-like domain-containing protein [Nocardioides sp. AE5]MDT0201082.1 Gmad2 immunoglobulin-like domain-containing protein [Nocardioides sp. AE5]
MSSHDKDTGRPESTEAIRRLLEDAVSDVEPGDRLEAIRHQTKKVSSMENRRPWIYAVTGAVVATAATVTAVAVLGNNDAPSSQEPGPATSQTDGGEETTPPSPDASGDPDGPDGPEETGTPVALPVYYLGDGPGQAVLFREFHQVRIPDPENRADRFQGALSAAVSADPVDPDYRHAWPVGTTIDTPQDGDISGEILTVRLRSGQTPLRERPSGMDEREAALSVEQLIYTAQAAIGSGRHPVQILLDGEPTDMVLGVPTAEPLANGQLTQTLSLMNITTPAEGEAVSASFTATGVNNGFEAWFGWEIIDADGTVVKEGFGMAEGAYEERLWAWQSEEIDVSDLAPGSYTFRAFNDDPSGGAEGNGPAEDTRTIVIE